MKTSTLLLLGALGALGIVIVSSGSGKKPAPNPNPLPDIPPLPKIPDDDVSRAEFLVRQWEENPATVKTMNPAELKRLSGVTYAGGRGDLGAKLSLMAALAEAPIAGGPVDNRPAPGFLPADLAARVSFMLNPAFETQVTAEGLASVIRDLEAFRGFDGQKDQLRRLKLRLGF